VTLTSDGPVSRTRAPPRAQLPRNGHELAVAARGLPSRGRNAFSGVSSANDVVTEQRCIGCFSSPQIPLFPTITVTSTRCRTSVSRSPSENPAAPSPSNQHELATPAVRDATAHERVTGASSEGIRTDRGSRNEPGTKVSMTCPHTRRSRRRRRSGRSRRDRARHGAPRRCATAAIGEASTRGATALRASGPNPRWLFVAAAAPPVLVLRAPRMPTRRHPQRGERELEIGYRIARSAPVGADLGCRVGQVHDLRGTERAEAESGKSEAGCRQRSRDRRRAARHWRARESDR